MCSRAIEQEGFDPALPRAANPFTIYVEPGTGRVTGHVYGRSLQDAMWALHDYLFIPRDVGFYLVTSLGSVLLGSLVTRLIVY